MRWAAEATPAAALLLNCPTPGSPLFDPAPPRPRLTCAGRCGARSFRSAPGDAERPALWGWGRRLAEDAAVRLLRGQAQPGRDARGLRPLKQEGKLVRFFE